MKTIKITVHPRHQFNYWTLLVDLHSGATFPGMRIEDVTTPEFRDDYEFLAKYAGYIASPGESPGAWVAFREGDFLKGDYTFLMERSLSGNSQPLYNINDSKYGLWGRKIAPGRSIKLELNKDFVNSLENQQVTVRVRYRDDNDESFTVKAFDQQFTSQKSGKGSWNLFEKKLTANTGNQEVEISAEENPLTLHMIEILR
jgi:hypothetical protein